METRSDGAIDAGRAADWGQASADYAAHRLGPPSQFYDMLALLGMGRPGQRVADIATGTGLLACEFARRGAIVDGVDIAAGQIAMAAKTARDERLAAQFSVAAAEETGLEAGVYDLVTANQCWLYFDKTRAAAEIARLLAKEGRLVISHFSFLARQSKIVAASEQVVLTHNRDWTGADWPGDWDLYDAPDGFRRTGSIAFDIDIAYTREGWRGRMRALRGIAASLDADAVAAFDADHEAMLRQIAPETFLIPHRVEASIFAIK